MKFVFYTVLLLGACQAFAIYEHIPTSTNNEPMKLAVFFDGTGQNEDDYTNIAKLHCLVTYQNNSHISTAYVEGLGTGAMKFLGLATGYGISKDIREAFLYLAENYDANRKDEIYIFGFSRGAYAARILAGLIYIAGIPSLKHLDAAERLGIVRKIYKAYTGYKTLLERRQGVAEILGFWPKSVDIEFMGLWDTVEALGLPDYKEDIDMSNTPYVDQICNIKHAAHALSIDDNRAQVFTPILLTRPHLTAQCEKPIDVDAVVDEVWFSGCHSDVGGGNKDTFIGGVSLNWMLKKLAPYHLVPKDAGVYADCQDLTHNPLSGMAKLIYKNKNRGLSSCMQKTRYHQGKIKIHQSVIDRLSVQSPRSHEYQWPESRLLGKCFRQKGAGLELQKSQDRITVVDYD